MSATPKILILAGRRAAALDPMAEAHGVSHKCLVPVGGVSMIGRTLHIAERAYPGETIYVSIDDFDIIRNDPAVAHLLGRGRLVPVEAKSQIVDSIVHASKTTGFPLLITTADNVLTTPEALHELTKVGNRGEAEAIVVVARREAIQAAHPEGQRRFYEFKDGGYSNCNLFWLHSERALAATEAFREGGQFAKRPERVVKAFGLLNLIRFRLGWNSLEQMFGFISRRFKVTIRPLTVADGRLAIDVDNERTHRVAEEILARDGDPETSA